MKKKLIGSLGLLVAVAIFLAIAVSNTSTRANDSTAIDENTPTPKVDCPPERCWAEPTTQKEMEEAEESPDERGTCTCGISYDADCHYEYVPAHICLPHWHEYEDSTTEEWLNVSTGTQSGVQKYDASSSQLNLFCSLPTDRGASAIKSYDTVGWVKGYIYNGTSGSNTTMEIFSTDASGNYTSHGSASSSSSGHQTLTVAPSGTNYYYWHAYVTLQDNTSTSLHGITVCYDPDGP